MYGQTFSMGGAPFQTNGNDLYINGKQYPGVVLNPISGETNALYSALREINGGQWLFQNADINAQGFYQINSMFPSTAFVQLAGGGLATYSAPAGSVPGFTFTRKFYVDASGNLQSPVAGTIPVGIINIQLYYLSTDVDWSAAYNRAYNYGLSLGRTFAIYFPDGIYTFGTGNTASLPFSSNMSLIGESQQSTILKSGWNVTTQYGAVMFNASATASVTNFGCYNLTMDGNYGNVSLWNLDTQAGPVHSNIYFDNVTFQNIGVPGQSNFNRAWHLNTRNGPTFGSGGTNLQLTNITVHDCHCYQFECFEWGAIDGVKVTGNFYNNNTQKPSDMTFTTSAVSCYQYCQNVSISGIFRNNGGDLILDDSRLIQVNMQAYNSWGYNRGTANGTSVFIVNCENVVFDPACTWEIDASGVGGVFALLDYTSIDTLPALITTSNNIIFDGSASGSYSYGIKFPASTNSITSAQMHDITVRGRYSGFSTSAVQINCQVGAYQPALTNIIVEDLTIPDGAFTSPAITLTGTAGAGLVGFLGRNIVVGTSSNGGGYAMSINGLTATANIRLMNCDFSRNQPTHIYPITFSNGGALALVLDCPGINPQAFTSDYPTIGPGNYIQTGVWFQSPYPDNRFMFIIAPSGCTITNISTGVWSNGTQAHTYTHATSIVGPTTQAYIVPMPVTAAGYIAWTGTNPVIVWYGA